MIKFSIFLRRRIDTTHEEFVAYHKEKHVYLFIALPEVKEHMRKYTQCNGLPVALPGLPDAYYDGITELWFHDVASIGKVFASESYMKTIRPDEEKFLDLHTCGFLVSSETNIM